MPAGNYRSLATAGSFTRFEVFWVYSGTIRRDFLYILGEFRDNTPTFYICFGSGGRHFLGVMFVKLILLFKIINRADTVPTVSHLRQGLHEMLQRYVNVAGSGCTGTQCTLFSRNDKGGGLTLKGQAGADHSS